jgi:putative membrane protein
MAGHRLYKRLAYSFLAGSIVVVLSACSASRQQPSANETIANAAPTPAVQPPLRSTTKHAHASVQSEPVSKSSTAAILARIHQSDLEEIALAKAAEEKASNDEVRSFADRLVKDYTTTDSQVIAIARKKNVHLSDSSHRGSPRKASTATGPSFDRKFLQQTSTDHDKQIKALKQEREDAGDDDIESLIDQTLPILEQHQELARLLMNKERA